MAEADVSLIDISTDITKLKVPELKRELKLRGLSTAGNKNELLDRLQKALHNSRSGEHDSVEENEELLEDILEDDDDEHLDASESLILDNDLDESPKGQIQKRKVDINEDIETKKPPAKKVILNRNTSIVAEVLKPPVETKSLKEESLRDEHNSEEKKIIKLSQINAKERLELRAKKFGITALSTDAKKAVRAERFGAQNGNSASSITSAKVATSVDVLKKRAERFGCSVSTAVLSLENQEKLEKRKARFGSSSTANGVNDDKAKARLERFKQPAA